MLIKLTVLIVFSVQKDSLNFFCVVYWRLNAVTTWEFYDVPCMDEYIYSLGESTAFFTLKSKSWNCQIEIDEWDHDIPASNSLQDMSRFTRMWLRLETLCTFLKQH